MDNETPIVSTDEMLNYLTLDNTEENNEVVSGLVKDAEAYINGTFNSVNLSASDLSKDHVYTSAVKALAGFMFYDRTLSQGVPVGIQQRITLLKGRYDKWQDDKSGN